MPHRWPRIAATLGENLAPADGPTPTALVVTCTSDCFDPSGLLAALDPAACRLHRTPGNVVPPRGAGFASVDLLLESAASLEAIVVCGHWPCPTLERLLDPDGPPPGLLARDWLEAAEAARRLALADPSLSPAQRGRALAEHNVCAQLAHLLTHPAVAAGRARLAGWLYDGPAARLLRPGDSGAFNRLVAACPHESRWLRQEYARARRPKPPGPVLGARYPYLA